jgi:hypothetical protein
MKYEIGRGYHRIVYQHENPDWVVKVPRKNITPHIEKFYQDTNRLPPPQEGIKQNKLEFRFYKNAPDDIKKHLVPCIKMEGNNLVQLKGEKTTRLKDVSFGRKDSDWVLINNKKLLCDYGSLEL